VKLKLVQLAKICFRIVAVVVSSNSLFGQDFVWTQTSAPTNVGLYSIASSADGTKLVAVGDETWVSTNSGVNWTQTSATNRYWYCVASSSDGTKLVGIETDVELVNGSWGSGIYTSTNFGTSWTLETNAPIMNWGAVASSADGIKLVAVTDGGFNTTTNGGIYTSTDSGNSWTKQTAAPTVAQGAAAEIPNWQGVASSADGTKLAAASYNGNGFGGIGVGICTSENSGATWTYSSAPIVNWYSIASSSNGMTLVALRGGWIYASTNSVSSWTQTNVPTSAELGIGGPAVASSADGTKLVAAANGGGIYTSTNSGMTWAQQTNAPIVGWRAVASSADGSKVIAVAINGGIYTGTIRVYPTLGILQNITNGALVIMPTASDMIIGENYQLQIANVLNNWTNFGSVFTATNINWTPTNFWNVANTNQMFFRLQMAQ
jgi:hypothetical protein